MSFMVFLFSVEVRRPNITVAESGEDILTM
jgi:hypothetical protein